MKKIYNDPQIQLVALATESAIMAASSVSVGGLDNVEHGGSTSGSSIGTADTRQQDIWGGW